MELNSLAITELPRMQNHDVEKTYSYIYSEGTETGKLNDRLNSTSHRSFNHPS